MTSAAHPHWSLSQILSVTAIIFLPPMTMKREVTPRLPSLGSLKHSFSADKSMGLPPLCKWVPKILVNLSFTLYWGKKPTVPWFSCFNLCSMTDSPLQQDVGTSTIPVFRKSKTLIISWKWSDAQEFCDPHSLAHGVPSITPYPISYRKHCSRCWGKANEPPTESWQVQQVNSPSCQLIPVGIYRTAGFPGTAHQCGKLKFSCSFLIHYYLHSILSKSHTAVTCPYYFIIYIIFSRRGPYWFLLRNASTTGRSVYA